MENRLLNKVIKLLVNFENFGSVRLERFSTQEKDFLENVLNDASYSPVFFLSTGRTGTKYFTNLLEIDKSVKVYHSPKPELIRESKVMYDNYKGNNFFSKNGEDEFFLLARLELLRNTYNFNKLYVETNNRITFFAHSIIRLIPNAKFVHLYRHPGEIIKSGMERGWYTGINSHDIGRITENNERWHSFSQEEKIAWMWKETNSYIENLKKSRPENFFSINFNEVSSDDIIKLTEFTNLNIDYSTKMFKKKFLQKVNIQKSNSYPHYTDWSKNIKYKVELICGDLMYKYGYKF